MARLRLLVIATIRSALYRRAGSWGPAQELSSRLELVLAMTTTKLCITSLCQARDLTGA
jgi:hypothetical protein